MEKTLKVLRPFFENPDKAYYIRELARLLKINHTSVRQHLNKLVKEGFLESKPSKVFTSFKAVISRKFLNLKLYYNLEKLWNSGLVEEIQKKFDIPIIVLFGSYSQALDIQSSDIDIFILSNITKEVDTLKYEKSLGRKVNILLYSHQQFEHAKKTNAGLVNSICNGIVLSGELEVLK